MVPLPTAWVRFFSPHRWSSALAARAATGTDLSAWLPLSVAPAATLEQILNVFPAMAAFVAAREMGRWWDGRRLWIVVVPVIGVALFESLLGLTQFYTVHAASSDSKPVSGTYVNRNHFAGLLELALPLVIMWAVSVWTRAKKDRSPRSAGAAARVSALLVVAACILVAVIGSLSRMGFVAALVAIATSGLGCLLVHERASHSRLPKWLWLFPALLPLAIFAFVAPNAMVLRFAETPGLGEINADGRVQIWKETMGLIGAYKWTGTGLGAYEYGLYPFRKFGSALTIDFAHNDYLQILAELGIVGALLVLALAIAILWRPLSIILERDSRHWALAVGLVGSFAAIGLHSLVDFNLYIPANALALAWLAGVAASPGLRET
jgi:O-antigen ligase